MDIIHIMVIMVTAMVMEKRKNNGRYQTGSDTNRQEIYLRLPERLMEILLICLIAFMPLAFGAVQPWSRQVVVVLSSAIVLLFLLQRIIRPAEKFTFTWAYLPVAAFLFLVVLQIVPLPQSIVSIISPQTVSLKKELLDQTANNLTISFYSSATKNDLRIILAVISVFVVVLNVFTTYEKIKRLLKAIVCVGAAVAIIAIIQDIAGNGKIYGFVTIPLKAISGPFVNHSHFGQFMNLSIGAAIALLLLKLQEDFESRQTTAANVFEYFDSTGSRGLWLIVGMISISIAAVFVSLTRGGMLSMLMAMCITVLLLAMRRSLRRHGWLVSVIALCAFVCLLYTGFDAVYERFATFSSLDNYGTRLKIVKDLLKPARQFAVLGTGLGTHAVIYPMFQSINTALRFSHAENEYMQLIEETGITGFVVMLSFGSIVAANFIKAIKNKKSSLNIAAYGLGFGLTAILIHSISDFGQHLPANAVLSAIFCALIINLGRNNNAEHSAMVKPQRIVLVILFVLIAAASIWSFKEADKARIAAGWRQKAYAISQKLAANIRQGSESDFEQMLSCASKAVQIQPDNIEYKYWLNVWRWWKVSRQIEPETGGLSNSAIKEVYEIADDLKKARAICPTFGQVYSLLGQLEKFVLLEPAGEDNIKKGFMLEPNGEVSLFAAGCLDITEDRPIDSFVKFRKSVQLGGTFFNEIVAIYIEQAQRPDLAIEIAIDNTNRLKYVANILSQNENYPAEAKTAELKMIELIEQKISKNTADAEELYLLGDYYQKNDNPAKAAESFSSALSQDYGNTELRLKYAQALAQTDRFDEAIQQARMCLKLRPGLKKAEKLIADLSVRPELIKKKIESPADK
jgi:tetratricopeptide (TPR) repeat protein